MTDTQKLAVANLLDAISVYRETQLPVRGTLAELEAGRAEAATKRAEATAALDAAMSAARAVCRT